MWIEHKAEADGLSGAARIGRVSFSKSGKSINYKGITLQSLKGAGLRANYFDMDAGDEYWVSGCGKDRRDALYSTEVEIDPDVQWEYWEKIRGLPEHANVYRFVAKGKY